MKRRIPPHVIARNRHAGEADANASYYNRTPEPVKPGGPCQLCGKPEDDHFAGMCHDFRNYTPIEEAKCN